MTKTTNKAEMPARRPSIGVQTWVIAYDVSDDRRRARLAKILEGSGSRIQYSLFECRLDQRRLQALRERLRREIDPDCDSLRCYPLCPPCMERTLRQGRDADGQGQDDGYFLV